MTVLRRIGVLSLAKILAILYAVLGLIVGGLFSLFALFAAAIGTGAGRGPGAILGPLFGVGAVIILPIFYGVLGFVFGLITAAVYNGIAGMVGGIELEFQTGPPRSVSGAQAAAPPPPPGGGA